MEIVAAQAGHILDDHPLDLARLDVGKHPLKARAVEICPGITVVLVVVPDGGIAVVAAILLQNLLLRWNLSRVFSAHKLLTFDSDSYGNNLFAIV